MANWIVLALVAVTGAAAQPAESTSAIASNPILGFETPASWIVKSSSAATKIASTTTRTQGNFAMALINPAEGTTMTSQPVASTAGALAGVGTSGALFELDVMPPASADTASLKLSVNSPSRGLKSVAVGQAQFQGLIPGIYNTVKFPIPDTVSDALGGAAFTDLTFEFVLSGVPTAGTRQFLFDNLRVYAVALVPAQTGAKAPRGFGGSVDLEAVGATPVTQTFTISAVQVPESFHLVDGITGATTVELALGHDSSPAFTCRYDADSTDATHQSYRVHSCTGGLEAGDIIGANFAQLTIVGGTDTMKLRPQLAVNPVGDLVGRKIIPPMPTFWGAAESCIPTAPAGGKVQPPSSSCAAQIAEASEIVTNYFNQVKAANAPFNPIATPVGDFARRHGTGAPHIVHTTSPTTTPNASTAAGATTPLITKTSPNGLCGTFPINNDFPYNDGSHLNQGGDFDAFWALSADMNFGNDPNSGTSCTHFDAEFSADVVLFGQDVNVVSLDANADTLSGSQPSNTGGLHLFLFGIELPGGGSVDPSTGLFNFKISDGSDFNLPPIQIWIFSITPGATASVGVVGSGKLAATGIGVGVTPQGSLGMHVLGGINIPGQFSGGIDARVDLLDISVPLTAQAGWGLNTNPQFCAAVVNFDFKGDLQISSGGGDLQLTATIGPCPFCWSDSWPLFHWPPLVFNAFNLFEFGPTRSGAIKLPVGLCTQPLNVSIATPVGNMPSGAPVQLTAGASSSLVSSDPKCADYQWNVFDANGASTLASGQDTLSFSSPGCASKVTFNGVGPRTVQAFVTDNIVDEFGRTIPQTGQGIASVNVVALPSGPNIVATNPVNADNLLPSPNFNNQLLNFTVSSFPATIQLTGEVVGFSNPAIIWTATDSNGKTAVIGLGPTVNWVVPLPGGLFTIQMAAAEGFNPIGTATMTANVEGNIR